MAPRKQQRHGYCQTMIFANTPGGERACANKVVDTFEGKGYCGVHSPERQKARRAKVRAANADGVRERNLREELRERYEEIGIAIVDQDARGEDYAPMREVDNNIIRCIEIRDQLAALTRKKEGKA